MTEIESNSYGITINTTTNNIEIDANVNDITIEVNLGASITNVVAYVEEDQKLYFNGSGGNCYMVYNSDTDRLEVYRGGTKRWEF